MIPQTFRKRDPSPLRPKDASAMVESYLARGGEIRRFEPGLSAQYASIQQFLSDHGWLLSQERNLFRLMKIGSKGRPARTTWAKVMERVDQLRADKGLTPLAKRAA